MGFFDSLVKAGTSALGALDDAATDAQLKLWNTLKDSDEGRILNVIKENGLSNSKSGIAVAAFFYNGHHPTSLTVCIESFEGGARDNKDTIKRVVSSLAKKYLEKNGYDSEDLYEYLSKSSEKMEYL